jgi:hypothetical protein
MAKVGSITTTMAVVLAAEKKTKTANVFRIAQPVMSGHRKTKSVNAKARKKGLFASPAPNSVKSGIRMTLNASARTSNSSKKVIAATKMKS